MDAIWMIQEMLRQGRISLDRAVELFSKHIDEIEAEWLNTVELVGTFDNGQIPVL